MMSVEHVASAVDVRGATSLRNLFKRHAKLPVSEVRERGWSTYVMLLLRLVLTAGQGRDCEGEQCT